MKQLIIKPSYICNNNCVFCFVRGRRNLNSYPFELIVNQIKKGAKDGYKDIVISGGDPLVYDKFFELLDIAIAEGMEKIRIQTNGRILAYKEFLDKIISKPAEFSFLVSFHFPNKETYMKYSQADGFDQTVEGIKNIIKSGSKIVVNTVLMKQNVNNLKEIVLLLKSLGIGKDKKSKHQIKFIDGHGLGRDFKKFVPKLSDVAPLVREVIKEVGKDGIILYDIPLCILGEDMVDIITPSKNNADIAVDDKVLSSDDLMKKKFILPVCCNECRHRKNCKGIKKDYNEQYGSLELKPIK